MIGAWCYYCSTVYNTCVSCAPPQHFELLTGHLPDGRRWVTKHLYISYFLLCYKELYADSNMTRAEQQEALEVGASLLMQCSPFSVYHGARDVI